MVVYPVRRPSQDRDLWATPSNWNKYEDSARITRAHWYGVGREQTLRLWINCDGALLDGIVSYPDAQKLLQETGTWNPGQLARRRVTVHRMAASKSLTNNDFLYGIEIETVAIPVSTPERLEQDRIEQP